MDHDREASSTVGAVGALEPSTVSRRAALGLAGGLAVALIDGSIGPAAASGRAVETKGEPPSYGPALGFQPQTREVGPMALRVRGSIPAWLSGSLLRTCAVPYVNKAWRSDHWFDGLCMLAGFRFQDGRVSFRNRFLDSNELAAARAGEARYAGAYRIPERSLLERLRSPLPPTTDNANISVALIGGKIVALGETQHQHDIDLSTLETLGEHRYDDVGTKETSLIAHPVWDPQRKALVSVGTRYGAGEIFVYEIPAGENLRRPIGVWRTRRFPYLHSFALTSTKAIIVDQPFRASLLEMAADLVLGRRAFFDCFSWERDTPTRLVIIDRASGESRIVETEPLFFFHAVNAWDEPDGSIVVDLLAIDHEPDLGELRYEVLRRTGPVEWPRLKRLRIATNGRVATETIGAPHFDFPMIDSDRATTAQRYVWGAGVDPKTPRVFASALLKLDSVTGKHRMLGTGDLFFGEPVLVKRPGTAREDDGVLLTVAIDAPGNRSTLLVLDAATLEERARADLPIHLPFGFHGRFFANA